MVLPLGKMGTRAKERTGCRVTMLASAWPADAPALCNLNDPAQPAPTIAPLLPSYCTSLLVCVCHMQAIPANQEPCGPPAHTAAAFSTCRQPVTHLNNGRSPASEHTTGPTTAAISTVPGAAGSAAQQQYSHEYGSHNSSSRCGLSRGAATSAATRHIGQSSGWCDGQPQGLEGACGQDEHTLRSVDAAGEASFGPAELGRRPASVVPACSLPVPSSLTGTRRHSPHDCGRSCHLCVACTFGSSQLSCLLSSCRPNMVLVRRLTMTWRRRCPSCWWPVMTPTSRSHWQPWQLCRCENCLRP